MDFRQLSYIVGTLIFLLFITVTKGQDEYAPYIGERYDTFDWNLVKSLESPNTGNAIISPISVKLVLAMLYEASTGSTEKQLQEVLSLPVSRHATRDRFLQIIDSLNSTSVAHTLDIGSRIFLNEGLKPHPKYEKILRNYYDSKIIPVDFSNVQDTKHQINSWANNVTHGHVKQLVTDSGIKDSIMVLANALYFKGLWRIPFERTRTMPGNFHSSENKTQIAPFMIIEENYYYADLKDFDIKFIRIPFKGKISMFIILPNQINGIREVIRNLNPKTLNELRWSLILSTVTIRLPKFSFEYKTKLKDTLQDLGLKDIFEDIASLPLIRSGDKNVTNVKVSNFIQKAGIEVNEEGSTAWAATEFELANKFGRNNVFDANRPFLFYLEDEFTGNVLFVGKVENPLEAKTLEDFEKNVSTKQENVNKAKPLSTNNATAAQKS